MGAAKFCLVRSLFSIMGCLLLLVSVGHAQGASGDPRDGWRPTAAIVPQLGHAAEINGVALSPDGRLALTAGPEDDTVKLWEVATGRELQTLIKHSRPVAFSPDGHFALSKSGGALRLWEVESGREARSFSEIKGPAFSAAFSPDGRTLVAGLGGGTVKLWDVATGSVIRTLDGHSDDVRAVAFSPDGRRIASAGEDATVRLWDAATGSELRTLKSDNWSESVLSLAFAPDGRTLVAGGTGGKVALWDTESGRRVRWLLGRSGSQSAGAVVYAVSYSPDGRLIAAVSPETEGDTVEVTLWDAISGSELRTFRTHPTWVMGLVFTPDGRSLLSVGGGSTPRLWDVATGRELPNFAAHAAPVPSVAMSRDGRQALSGSEDSTLTLWDIASGRAVRAFAGHRGPVKSVALSPDGRIALSGSSDSTVRLWDTASGRELRTLSGHEAGASVDHVALSPDGRLALSGSSSSELKLWQVDSGRLLRSVTGHRLGGRGAEGRSYPVNSVAFSPDGRMALSTGNDSTMKLWDVATLRAARTMSNASDDDDKGALGVAFSPDGRRALLGDSRGGVTMWNLATGKALRRFELHAAYVRPLVFVQNGHAALSGSGDRTLKLWEVDSGRVLRSFEGHRGAVRSIAVTPDEKSVISASDDGTLKIWDLNTGEQRASLIKFDESEWVTITPEGFFDASANGAKYLTVVRGLDAYSVDQFYNELYRPDLVREKLAGDPRGLVREAAAKMNLTKAIASGKAPRVVIVGLQSGALIKSDQATFEADVTDQGGGIGKVEWRVNGVTLGLEERGIKRIDRAEGAPPASRQASVKFSRTLGLSKGENRIAVVAYNAAGLVASEPVEIVVSSAPEETGTQRLYVLAVGVNDYWDSALRLSFAAPDAKSLSVGLQKAGGKLYERIELRTVLDAEATAAKLDEVFAELGKAARPQDVFVFFLAGHGKTVDGRFYFLPQDFRYAGEDSIVARGIGQDLLQSWFARIKAQKSVLLFDACESGSLVGERIASRGLAEKTAVDRMTRAMGRTMLTATTGDKPAFEGYRGHGAFTYVALAAFAEADTNGDGVIDVLELVAYVDRQLPSLTFDAFRLRQVPRVNVVGSNFPLALKTALLSPGSASSPTAIPTTPSHVVIAPSAVRESADEKAAVVMQLAPGAQVRLVESVGGWAVIARDGVRLGFVPGSALARLQ